MRSKQKPHQWPAVLTVAAMFLCGLPVAAQPTVRDLQTRPGVKVRVLYAPSPTPAQASVVLLTGGYGKAGIYPNGSMDDTNFLTNSLARLNALQVNALVMDSPTDKRTLDNFRHTTEHAQDLAAVVSYLKEQSNAPVWLAGISNGALSAAHGAATAGTLGPDGVVLLSTLTKEGVSARAGSPVYRTAVDKIRVPVVLIHHKQDGCYVTPFEGIAALKNALTAAPRVTVLPFEGGSNQGNPCHAGHHLFQGLEGQVIESMVQAIQTKP